MLINCQNHCLRFSTLEFSRFLGNIKQKKQEMSEAVVRRCSVKKGVLRNFEKFTGKHPCQSLFFNKVAGLPPTLLKKRLWYGCFPVNFAKFPRTRFLAEHLWRLLLKCEICYNNFVHWKIETVVDVKRQKQPPWNALKILIKLN